MVRWLTRKSDKRNEIHKFQRLIECDYQPIYKRHFVISF